MKAPINREWNELVNSSFLNGDAMSSLPLLFFNDQQALFEKMDELDMELQ
jgi:hypothetical protein